MEDDEIHGDLCLFVDELIERHAPRVARMSLERMYAGELLEENLEAMRQREAARLIRQAVDDH